MFRRFVDWTKKHRAAAISAVLGVSVVPFIQEHFKEVFKHWIYSKIVTYAEGWLSDWGAIMLAEFGSYVPSVIAAVMAGLIIYVLITKVLAPRPVPTNGINFRQIQALADQASALREHAEELRKQREVAQQRTILADNGLSQENLPQNAKFRLRGEIYWHAARPYTPDEARDMRALIRETYDYINGYAGVLVANYAGPLTMFTRNWQNIVCRDGPKVATEQLNNFRNEAVINLHNRIQELLTRKPYFQGDLSDIIGERGAIGELNGAFNDYISALSKLPQNPSPELTKDFIEPKEQQLETAVQKYSSWIAAFNGRVNNLRPELEKLSNIDSA
jgi:hypothetical protein